METLYIIAPAYNESANIEKFVDDWYPIIKKHSAKGKSRLVIINDGSTDDTYKILKKLAKTRPLLKPLTKENSGHGPTVIFGYNYAVKHRPSYVFQTDSDNQTTPRDFEKFWKLRKKYDCVLGNRTIRGDGKDRKLVESFLCRLLKHYFGVDIPDSNAPFRLMKTSVLKKYLPTLPPDYNLPNVMLSTFFVKYSEKVHFEPISFAPRTAGKNSINLKRIVKIGSRAIVDFRHFRREMRSKQ